MIDLASSSGASLVGDKLDLTAARTLTQHDFNKRRIYADQITGIDPDGADCCTQLQTLVSEMLAAGYQ